MSTLTHDIPYLSFQLRDDLERYLVHSRKLLNEMHWYYNGRRLEVDALHIDQNVITEQIQQRRSLIGNEEQESKPEIKQHPLEITNQAHLYELTERFSERVRTRWSVALGKRDLKLAIIGAPGSGKSFTTTNEVIRRIDEVLYQSHYRACPLDDIQIPIWVTATEFASQNTNEPAEAIEKIVRASMKPFRLSEKFFRFLRQKLDLVFDEAIDRPSSSAKHLFLVVDSLDELPQANLSSFKKISSLLDKSGLQLIVTCRTFDWPDRQSDLGFAPKETVEIAPLTPSQQRRFTDNFFCADDEQRSAMRTLFDGNPALQHAFTTPLLLTFGCLLHGDGVLKANTGYVKMYGLVIAGIFEGRWRSIKPYWHDDDVKTAQHIALLDKVGWSIFQANPAVNLFTQGDWEKACENLSSTLGERAIIPGDFLGELRRLGFVQRAGFNDRAQQQWSFKHRTFLEFLAARALSERSDWLEIARGHFWFAPEWLECLTFLVGLLDVNDATNLIDAVRAEKNDIFGSMTFLEAKLTGASNLRGEVIGLICDQIVYGLADAYVKVLEYRYGERSQILKDQNIYKPYIKSANSFLELNIDCFDYVFENFIKKLIAYVGNYENDEALRVYVGLALCKLWKADREVVNFLVETLRNDENDSLIRVNSISALCELREVDDTVINVLVDTLRTESELFVLRGHAARALGNLANTDREVIDVLVQTLRNNSDDVWVSDKAVDALVKLCRADGQVIEVLDQVLRSKSDNIRFHFYLAEVLAHLGEANDLVIDCLLQVFRTESEDLNVLRNRSVEALVNLGKINEPVVDLLNRIRSNEGNASALGGYVRNALWQLGNTDSLLFSAKDQAYSNTQNEPLVRLVCACDLVRFGKADGQVVEFLVEFLRNAGNDSVERGMAAEALGELRKADDHVVNALVQILRDESVDIYLHDLTAKALSNLGKVKDVPLSLIVLLSKQLDKAKYVLNSDFADPLFQIRHNSHRQDDFIWTWGLLLEKDEDKTNNDQQSATKARNWFEKIIAIIQK